MKRVAAKRGAVKRFLLIGKSGVGKSSFVNATFGVQLASWCQFEPCTKLVESYARTTEFGDVCLIDTPGFADDSRETDCKYLILVNSELAKNNIDVLMFFSRLDDKRFRGEDKEVLRLISVGLDKSVWNNAWLVFTFCAKVSLDVLDKSAAKRKVEMETYLKNLLENNAWRGFKMCILMDNVTPNWHPSASVITKVLNSD